MERVEGFGMCVEWHEQVLLWGERERRIWAYDLAVFGVGGSWGVMEVWVDGQGVDPGLCFEQHAFLQLT